MFRQLPQRVQSFYKTVAGMVSTINSRQSTIKTEIYRTKTPERFHALLHKVLINYPVLRDVVQKTGFMKDLRLGSVIAYELLTKNLRNDGYRRQLTRALGDRQLKTVTNRTFVRINTLRGSVSDLKDFDLKETCIPDVYECTSDKVSDLLRNPEVAEKIKIQNFSSCLPAFILNPEKNSVVIDATASPGNKTTHLCSIMENTGKIHAFERNQQRFETLVDQVQNYGAENIETIHGDFLKADPSQIRPDYILLDPSCSGSGIHINYTKSQKRIDTLHNFQAMMLNHALKFGAKAVVYSVCSVHSEEGEDVVKEALEKNPEYELETIGDYTRERGLDGYDFSQKVVRTSAEDGVGFFVALFRKK